MDRYTRILVAIFIISLINLGLNIYILQKRVKPIETPKPVVTIVSKPSSTPTPSAQATNLPSVQTDLDVIKAELKAIRDILEP